MPRILIVDDEPSIRTLLSAAFGMAGYEVRTAPDGPEAMALCKAERFDAVLSDVVMPKMTGHELAQWIATEHPATRTILMSGFDLACQDCPHAGRCMLIPKPFRPRDAVAQVETALARDSG
jgi:DNA-binding NtrC family response regulator